MEGKDQPTSSSARSWTWFPTWYEVRTHYLKEVGFLACFSQLIGATIFVSLEPSVSYNTGDRQFPSIV